MFMIKKYLIRILVSSIMTILFTTLLTALYYYDFISHTLFTFFLLFGFLFILFLNSYLLGRVSSKKGYLEGIKYGIVIICSFFTVTLICSKFQWKLLFYYAIILLTTVSGSIFGINKKKV